MKQLKKISPPKSKTQDGWVDMAVIDSEIRYRRLFETAQDGILILDGNTGEIADVNPFLQNMLGYSRQEFLGKQLWEIGLFKDIEESKAAFAELDQKKYIRYDDLPLKTKGGRRKDVEFVSNVYQVDHERVIQCNIRDISERKRLETSLNKSEDFNSKLVEASPIGIVYLNKDHKITYENQAMQRNMGVPIEGPSPVIGKLFFELPSIKKAIPKSVKKAILNGIPVVGEVIHYQSLFGKDVDLEIFTSPLKSEDGQFEGTILAALDITEKKRIEGENERQANFLSQVGQGVIATDQNGLITYMNKAAEELYGWKIEEAIGRNIIEVTPTQATQAQGLEIMARLQNGQSWAGDFLVQRKDGTIFPAHVADSPILDKNGNLIGIVGISFDVTEQKKAEEKLMKLSSVVEQTADSVFITDRQGVIEYVNPAFVQMTGYSKEEAVGQSPRILKSGIETEKVYEELWSTILADKVFQNKIINRKKNGELFYEQKTISPIRDELGNLTHFVSTGKDITERMQRERELEAIFTVSAALRISKTLDEMLPLLLDSTLQVLGAEQGAIWLYDPIKNELCAEVTRGWGVTGEHSIPPEKPGEGINGYVFDSGEAYISREICEDLRLPEHVRCWAPPGVGGVTIPIRSGTGVIGTFNVNVTLPRVITPNEVSLLSTLSEIAGNAIQRTRLFEKTEQDAQRLAALHTIDMSISATDDLGFTLDILLNHVVDLLQVSGASILLINPVTQRLEYSAAKGFRSSAINKSNLRLDEGYAGRAVRERRTVTVPDLRTVGSEYARKNLLASEDFIAYYGVPLITKDKVIGVLDIFNRNPLTPDSAWLDFMEALANQAAIAIESATLFTDLHRSNIELLQAYDTTIEGWSLAMDLRDHDTEGHTQRVTNLTVQLSRALGMSEEEIIQVRRGALLHDMGKMGIPDGILLKAGPLTDEEWVNMRKHPQYAFDMLSPIGFLKPALDIPYCHHEKWDGTGYPRGLEGEQIPMAARLFAIVDVWDALRSDRPYRQSWSEEKVVEHIKSLSGTHFDPKVVELFLNMILGKMV